ncbi:MAG: hypothetical protein HY663_06845 [Chloroflexi bacterium]|nr:hypothetical protein [Chloroflexota bacterium]
MDINLTQAEADALISLAKYRENDDVWNYPSLGGSVSIPLVSSDKREGFMLDISHGRIDLLKGKHQNRARQVCILVRLEFGGAPHRNPDGIEIPCPHLHLYREGYGDKWAIPVPNNKFSNTTDIWQAFQDFMTYCNIVSPPNIQRGFQP